VMVKNSKKTGRKKEIIRHGSEKLKKWT